jgi:hypothetical protein
MGDLQAQCNGRTGRCEHVGAHVQYSTTVHSDKHLQFRGVVIFHGRLVVLNAILDWSQDSGESDGHANEPSMSSRT